ncbi:hypothetical protein [Ketobacter sp.]|uniref:hypothetical protein n=1 Tax=Ketobacter sp. TaxID=2083498 RepID=UPI0025BF95F6|nr:hypothetical protein [Ketobacter sp.]
MLRMMLVFSLLLSGWASPVQAEDRALQNALAKAQYMLRQTTAEKQELQQQLDAVRKELEQQKEQAASALAAKEKSTRKLGDKLDLYNEKYTELQTQYLDLLSLLREQQSINADLDEKLATEVARFDQCRNHNLELFTLNQEILGKYKDKGFWDVVAKSEPVTGFKQVEIENIIQEYRFENEDLLIDGTLISKKTNPALDRADN